MGNWLKPEVLVTVSSMREGAKLLNCSKLSSRFGQVLVLILLVLVSSSNSIAKELQSSAGSMLHSVNIPLKPGDLVFRRVDNIPNQFVSIVDEQMEYSHVGIVWQSGNADFVIHVTPGKNGVVNSAEIEPVEEFLQPAYSFAVFRLREDADGIGIRAADYAHVLIGNIIFDNKFDLSTDEAQYCTELVWKAYLKAGIDLVDGMTGYADIPFLETNEFVFISSLLDSERIQQIYP